MNQVIQLNDANLGLLSRKVRVPQFDRSALRPTIVHIGAGNFFRAHLALYTQDAIEKTGTNAGIFAVNVVEDQRTSSLRHALNQQQGLYTILEKDAERLEAKVCSVVSEVAFAPDDIELVLRRLSDPQIQAITMTITEGGYFRDSKLLMKDVKQIKEDLKDPTHPCTVPGIIVEALRRRFEAKVAPFMVISCDNVLENGDAAKEMIIGFADMRDSKLSARIASSVRFPNSMVDRITPASSPDDIELCRERFGIEDNALVSCEPFRQWVIETQDELPGLPRWDLVGAKYVKDVKPYELVKLRLLNAGHSGLGYTGYLAGMQYIYQIARDADFSQYLFNMLTNEVAPLLSPPPGLSTSEYIETVIHRFQNNQIKDTALRICCDGSSKLPKFVLPSIREALEHRLPFARLALCLAGWIRFLDGTDEQGGTIIIEDPRATELQTLALVARRTQDVAGFISQAGIFGNLESSTELRAEVQKAYSVICSQGARAAVQRYV